MLAILSKVIPFRDWIYLGVFVALIGGFVYYTHHERVIGAQKIEAADKAAAQKQAATVAKVEDNARTELQSATQAYAAAMDAAHAPAPKLVCYSAAPNSGRVPGHAGTSGSGNGTPSVPAESSVPFDPAPAILDNDKQADAQVALLQSYIRACQSAGICAK
jgi:hypothetical protein